MTHISLIPFVIKAAFEQGIPERHTVQGRRVRPDHAGARPDAGHAGGGRLRHDRAGHPLHPLQPVRAPTPDLAMGKVSPGYEFLVVKDRTARWPRSARRASCGSAASGACQSSSSTSTTPRRTRSSSPRTAGFATGDMVQLLERRQHRLPGPRQGRPQGRRRERVGPRGRGRHPRRRRAARRHRGRGQAARHARHGAGRVRDPRRPVRTTGCAEHARSSRPAGQNLADFKVPRAVYFVDEFPTAALGKVSKKDLRELADTFPDV